MVNVSFNGGRVSERTNIYVVFWGKWWRVGARNAKSDWKYSPQFARKYVVSFFARIGKSPWAGTLRPYGARVETLRGAFVDVRPIAKHPTPAQVQAEALQTARYFHAPTNFSLVTFRTKKPMTLIVVLTPPGFTQKNMNNCGYHDIAAGVPYIYLPFAPSNLRCGTNAVNSTDAFGHGIFDGFSIIGSHELAEAITDAQFLGWYDVFGNEVADKCAWQGLANTVAGGELFAVQPVWENRQRACKLAA
jgi:hypothetical protein